MQLLAGQAELAGQACRRFALGKAAQQQYQRRRPLSGLFEDGAGEQRIVPLTAPTAVCGKVPLLTEETPFGAATVGAGEPSRMQVTFEPDQADAVVQEFGNWEVDHVVIIPQPAR